VTTASSPARAAREANWATTDAICGLLVGPLLLRHAEAAPGMRTWARSRNMWVRPASIVGLIQRARRGESLDLTYEIAGCLTPTGKI
jgi:3-methyladenine DNA glycosylase AlkD